MTQIGLYFVTFFIRNYVMTFKKWPHLNKFYFRLKDKSQNKFNNIIKINIINLSFIASRLKI